MADVTPGPRHAQHLGLVGKSRTLCGHRVADIPVEVPVRSYPGGFDRNSTLAGCPSCSRAAYDLQHAAKRG